MALKGLGDLEGSWALGALEGFGDFVGGPDRLEGFWYPRLS